MISATCNLTILKSKGILDFPYGLPDQKVSPTTTNLTISIVQKNANNQSKQLHSHQTLKVFLSFSKTKLFTTEH